MSYDFDEGRKRVNKILNSPLDVERKGYIPSNESNFTFNNGIKTNVGAIFIDIRNSTEYFKENPSKQVSKVIRAFCSEIITILKENSNIRQIGIRGDCVFGIYTIPTKEDLINVLNDAVTINTFQEKFQEILKNRNMQGFDIGIGVGYGENDLVIKAGKEYSGINDYIWVGDAVIDACNLSSLGNSSKKFSTIVITEIIYEKIKNSDYGDYFENIEQINDDTIIRSDNLVWDFKDKFKGEKR